MKIRRTDSEIGQLPYGLYAQSNEEVALIGAM